MSVENLIRYKLVHSPAGYSDFVQMCDKGECGEYVKFEEAEEAMEASSNSLKKLKAEIAAIEHKAIGFIGTTEAINILNVVLQELRQLSV